MAVVFENQKSKFDPNWMVGKEQSCIVRKMIVVIIICMTYILKL